MSVVKWVRRVEVTLPSPLSWQQTNIQTNKNKKNNKKEKIKFRVACKGSTISVGGRVLLGVCLVGVV